MLKKASSEAGFSYIDVIIAILILMVGILAMIAALTANLVRSFESEKRVIAKQLALSTIESIVSTKEIGVVGASNRQNWDRIQNTPNPGIFLPGFNPIRAENGADGVAGTADDACAGAGPCGANISLVMGEYSREIIVTDINDPERPSPLWPVNSRRVDVNIRYFAFQLARTESASTVLTFYEK